LGGGLVWLSDPRGMRPRSLTVMPRSFAHAGCPRRAHGLTRSARVGANVPASLAGVLDEERELPAERCGVLCAQVDLVVGAAEVRLTL